MIQKIQPYEIFGMGTATEVKVEVQTRYTTQEKAIIYYDLRDPNGTTNAFDSRIGDYVTLPYKILSYKKIVVSGSERDDAITDTNLAVDQVFRKRTELVKSGKIRVILVSISSESPEGACQLYLEDNTKEYFIDNEDFTLATQIATDKGMTEIVSKPAYIVGDSVIRYWDGKNFDKEFLMSCKGKK